MHKIDSPTATPDGLFTIGDPVGGMAPTVVTDDWLNAVQTEIVNVIEEAGETLDKPDNTQLLQAIQTLIAEAVATIPVPPPAFITGDVMMSFRTSSVTGWIPCNDGTIGNSGSGATTFTGPLCQALYTLLWNNVPQVYGPVTGGRGASAAADWAANKPLALTKMLGRVLGVAGGVAGAGLALRTVGMFAGEESHLLTEAEMPLHGHPSFTVSTTASSGSYSPTGGFPTTGGGAARAAFTGTPNATIGQQIGGTGGGGAHNVMQPTTFLIAYIKL